MEYYYCLGCDPDQENFVTYFDKADKDNDIGKLNLCASFAERLWESSVTYTDGTTTTIDPYSKCGLRVNVESNLTEGPDMWKVGHYNPSAERNVVIPHKVFASKEAFLEVVKPPFFSNFKINIVEEDSGIPCFSSATRAFGSIFALLLFVAAAAMIRVEEA